MAASQNGASKPVMARGASLTTSFTSTTLKEEQADVIWRALKLAIHEIQEGNASQLRFEELYRNAYTLVLHKHGDLLYDGVYHCVRQKLLQVSERVQSSGADMLLEVIVHEWENHKLIMTMIRDILMYMDKTYCRQKDKAHVYEMGLQLFKSQVVKQEHINGRLRAALLENVWKERNGEPIDRVLMKSCLAMLIEVGVSSPEVYQTEFERQLLETTRYFYQQESQDFISSNTVPDYLRKVQDRLTQEDERASTYLHHTTRSKLRDVVQEELITKYAKTLVDNDKSGCVVMFQRDSIDDLRRMFNLYKLVPKTLAYLRDAMYALVKETGTNLVKDQETVKNPMIFVQQVLDCRTKYHTIVEAAFDSDRNFMKTLKEALEYFINLDSRAAQYLSLYIDELFRKGLKGMSDADVQNKLKNVIDVFRYLQDKDVFEDFYKQHLAQRLLNAQSGSDEVEKSMITKLKAECGHQFTSRLEGMFKDMAASKDTMRAFTQHVQKANLQLPVDLNITVLTTGFWPIPKIPQCTFPQPVDNACKSFNDFYTRMLSGRRLTWQTHLGSAELRCRFDKGRKELVVHTYQMCILALFNKKDTYTYSEIADHTKIPDQELQRHLLSLAHPKVKVLKKLPNTKAIEPSHKFQYNTAYTSNLFRVKIKLLPQVAAAPAQAAVPVGVAEARKNRVEAAIVRVMKTRKELEHSNLIAEVMKQLTSRFAVDPSFIKKGIESLIEREYLARDKNDRRLYHYLA